MWKRKMIIAEDNEMNRKMLQHIFEDDYELLLAVNGEEACKYLNAYGGDISIILLDLGMPVKNGYEVILEMKQNTLLKDIPIIVVTAFDQSLKGNAISDMGVDEIIYKPFDLQLVKNRVENVIIAKNYQLLKEKNKKKLPSSFYPLPKKIDQTILNVPLSKLFSSYRLIGLQDSKVYYLKNQELCLSEMKDYDLCSKIQSYNNFFAKDNTLKNDSSSYRIEYYNNRIYLVALVPMCISNMPFVLELLVDVSDKMYISNKDADSIYQKMNVFLQNHEKLSNYDLFTLLYNKTFIYQVIVELIHRKEKFKIVVFDLNKFKNINDSYGHIIDDKVILAFSTILREVAANCQGKAGRIGGDEFLLLLKNEHDAVCISESIAYQFNQEQFIINGEVFHPSVSYGIADSSDGNNFIDLINHADRNMYEKKFNDLSDKKHRLD